MIIAAVNIEAWTLVTDTNILGQIAESAYIAFLKVVWWKTSIYN